ncbi:MAG: ATP-binding protein [Marinoscillum sp.]
MIKKHLSGMVLYAILLLIVGVGNSQNKDKADSLRELLPQMELDTNKLYVLYKLTTFSSDPNNILEYANQLKAGSLELGSIKYEVLANHHIGVGKRMKGETEVALKYLFEAATKSQERGLSVTLTKTFLEIAGTYMLNEDKKNALMYYTKAIEILRNTNDNQTLAITLLNTGYSYYQINSLDTALSYYNEAEPIFEEIDLEIGKAYTIGNRALVFWKQGNAEKAIEDLNLAIGMLEPLGDQFGMADYYNQLGSIYLEMDDHVNALTNTEKGLEMAMAVDLKEQIRDASRLLAQLYEEKGDYPKAFDYQSRFIAYKDSIQDEETTRRLADLRTEFEVGQKEAELEVISAEKRTQQILSVGLGVILLLTGVFAVVTYKNFVTKKRINSQLEEQAVVLEEQKEELVKLNKTKDKFFSIISHDLRGPITSFFGISPIIKSFVKSKKTDDLLEIAEDIDKSVRQLSDLLDNLLSWATQQQAQIPFNPKELDIHHMANRVKQNLQNVASGKGIELTVEVSEHLRAFADRNIAETIVRNLTSNALKFTPNGGRVTIGAQQNGSMMEVFVKDTGVGIPEEVMKTMFELTSAQSTYGTDGERGLGLGLQLVQEFTQLNGGQLHVDSKVGAGTTFTFSLPKMA